MVGDGLGVLGDGDLRWGYRVEALCELVLVGYEDLELVELEISYKGGDPVGVSQSVSEKSVFQHDMGSLEQ